MAEAFDEAADYKGVHGFFLVPDSSAASSSLFAVCAAAIASSLVVAVPILTNFRSLWRMTSHRNPRGEMSFTIIPNFSITRLYSRSAGILARKAAWDDRMEGELAT
jgi:hypothetical protein